MNETLSKDILLGYKLSDWGHKLQRIASSVEEVCRDSCMHIERITDEIDDFMRSDEQ